MVGCLIDNPNTITMVVLFVASVAWLWRSSHPHPMEPLQKG